MIRIYLQEAAFPLTFLQLFKTGTTMCHEKFNDFDGDTTVWRDEHGYYVSQEQPEEGFPAKFKEGDVAFVTLWTEINGPKRANGRYLQDGVEATVETVRERWEIKSDEDEWAESKYRTVEQQKVRIKGSTYKAVVELYYQIRAGRAYPTECWDGPQIVPQVIQPKKCGFWQILVEKLRGFIGPLSPE